MPDRVGHQLGNYRLLKELGRGAFAEVYLAEHLYLERLTSQRQFAPLVRDGGAESKRAT